MNTNVFGMMVVGALSTVLTTGTWAANGNPASAGKCMQACKSHASCKGQVQASCKGQNSSASKELESKDCSMKTIQSECEMVKDESGKNLCAWK